MYLHFFQADVAFPRPTFLFFSQVTQEVLFLQHRIAISIGSLVVPHHCDVLQVETGVFRERCATSWEISSSVRLNGDVKWLNSASKSNSMDSVNIFCFQRQETKSQER